MVAYDTVVMPVETTARELNAKIYMAICLARAGFRCFFGAKDMTFEVARRVGHAIYLDKGFHRGVSEPLYRALRKAGCLLVSLDEENGVDFKDFRMLNTRMPDEFLAAMDLVLLWGERQNAFLAANRENYSSQRVCVTGHPRFDLQKPVFRPLYADKVVALQERYGSFILFNTNSKYSNNISGRESVIANYAPRVRDLRERLIYDDQRLALNISLIRRIAIELGKTVVVRPHPEESIAVYQRAFADIDNVYTVYEDSALYWILAATGVIHNHSTTGIEAAVLGKTPLAYTPIPTEENFCPWIPIACSHRIEKEDDVIAFIKRDGWREQPPLLEEVLNDYFSYDTYSMPRVESALLNLRRTREFRGKSQSFGAFIWRKRFSQLKADLIGREIGSRLTRNKLKELRPQLISERYKTLMDVLPPGSDTRLKALHPRLYEVSPL